MLSTIVRRAVGLFNVKKAPVRAKIARAWIDQRIRQSDLLVKPTLAADLHKAGIDISEWHRSAIANSRLYASSQTAALDRFRGADPQRVKACVRDAETILGHRFDLLGSGPYAPRCPLRKAGVGDYQPIDWALDPVRKVRFREDFPYKEWDLFRDRPLNGDIKYPWELSRCQHFLTLAQAWRCTSETRFAQEILDEIADFDARNPPGVGVNWTCTMDVGIRAANWALALDIVNKCEGLQEERLFEAYESLFAHGHFIRSNLENTYETTSNHYLANVVGLHFIGAFFHDLPTGKEWLKFAAQSVEREMDTQVLADGADFESSVPYHRLVIELFLGSFRLSQHMGAPFSAHFARRLGDMVDYLVGVLLPNGEMPIFGDADDGRLMIATDYGSWNRKDPRHVLGPAALALSRDDWRRLAPSSARWEALWWGFDGTAFTPEEQTPPDNVKLYPDAGAAVSRADGRYLLVTNSIVGTKGFGNHKHNEQLSFELHDEGIPLIVDPGSYVYTSDFEARNLFRSTANHNTIVIDGAEQNEFRTEWLFRMFEKANPEHLLFEERDGVVIYEGLHRGYERLERPMTHKRRFEHHRQSGALRIEDRLIGEGAHDLLWSFHFHPGVTPRLGSGSVALAASGKAWRLTWNDDALDARIEDSWFSPSYGVRVSTKVLRLRKPQGAGGEWRFDIEKEPGQ
ncbi:MAG: alginate lyase family protein [Parvularculaceae bacterium]